MERGTKSSTLADLLPLSAKRYGSAPAVRCKQDGEWVDRSFDQVLEVARSLSLGLIDLGVAKGDKVSILGNTRPEWTYFDFAALSAGAVVVPIYQTNSPEECQYVLENSDAKVVVVEDDEQMEKVRAVRDRLPLLEHVVRRRVTELPHVSVQEGARVVRLQRDGRRWEVELEDSSLSADLVVDASGRSGRSVDGRTRLVARQLR